MENFEKGETVEVPIDHREPFCKALQLPEDVLTITVRGGSKMETLLDVAIQGMNLREESVQILKEERDGGPFLVLESNSTPGDYVFIVKDEDPRNHRSVVFFGAGPAINKVISCVEILKRRVKDPLQQITKLSYQEVHEMWNPKLEGLNVLKVTRKVPMIHVLLSKDPLNADEPGYDFNVSIPEIIRCMSGAEERNLR